MKHPLQSVGSVLGRMPIPGEGRGGVMHRIPALQWKTWVRLAFVEAGSDWRSLNKLAVEDGALRDFLICPEMRGGVMGVHEWDDSTGAVCGRNMPSNGAFSIADPRMNWNAGAHSSKLRMTDWEQAQSAITGARGPYTGATAIADPRMSPSSTRHYNLYRVIHWDRTSNVVAGSSHVGGGAMSVADPRRVGPTFGKYGVTDWKNSAGTVISGSTTGQGAFAVADPRAIAPYCEKCGLPRPCICNFKVDDPRAMHRSKGDHYLTGGHYGVVPWQKHCGAVSSSACHDNGNFSVADPRIPRPDEKTIAVIRSLDGTWHRPFTTLELAALQGLVCPEEQLELDGLSDQAWRERIGNAVPAPAAQAIASEMFRTLLLAWTGSTMSLALTPIWVRPAAVAMNLARGEL
ncbi:MAG: hypothetical protein A3K04_10040 [Gallionellales bacterium RBG_16_56_9]|nr:MAG: hypothetical protein A3K04_10040 [Gallionellales bacterium RBG_16_56_9]